MLFDASDFAGADLVSAGLPCPPFSVAGKQLGEKDERNLFPAMIRIVDCVRPSSLRKKPTMTQEPSLSG
jgi:DNA (cytosine-5)-methyltransferase 1